MADGAPIAPEPHGQAWRVQPAEAARMLKRLDLLELRTVPLGNPLLALVPVVHALLDRNEALEARMERLERRMDGLPD